MNTTCVEYRESGFWWGAFTGSIMSLVGVMALLIITTAAQHNKRRAQFLNEVDEAFEKEPHEKLVEPTSASP